MPTTNQRFKVSVREVNYPFAPLNIAGDLAYHPKASIPSGWVLADGTYYTTAEKPELFAAIGYRFGTDGAGRFRVPEIIDFLEPTVSDLLSTTDAALFTVVSDGVRPHNHGTGTLAMAGKHSHTFSIIDWVIKSNHWAWNGAIMWFPQGPPPPLIFLANANHTHNVTATTTDVETAPQHVTMALCVCSVGFRPHHIG